jgi:hypothetical protein
LKKKIGINMSEYKSGMFVSRPQAIAVSYSQVRKSYPGCSKFIGSKKVSRKGSKKGSKKSSRKGSRKGSKKVSKKSSRKGSKKVSKKSSRKSSRKGSKKSSRKVSKKSYRFIY